MKKIVFTLLGFIFTSCSTYYISVIPNVDNQETKYDIHEGVSSYKWVNDTFINYVDTAIKYIDPFFVEIIKEYRR